MWSNALVRRSTRSSHPAVVKAVFMTMTLQRRCCSNTSTPHNRAPNLPTQPPTSETGTRPSSAASAARPGSRFTRPHSQQSSSASATTAGNREDNKNSYHPYHHNSENNSSGGGGVVEPPLSVEARMVHLTVPLNLRSARALQLYLQRINSVVQPTSPPCLAAQARREVRKLFLPAIRDMDAATVVSLLLTAEAIGLQGAEPVVQDAVAYLTLHEAHLSPPQYVKVVMVLDTLEVAFASKLVSMLPQRLSESSLAEMPLAEAAALLCAVLPRLRYLSTASPAAQDGEMPTTPKPPQAGSTSAAAGRESALASVADALRERCVAEGIGASLDATAQVRLLRAAATFMASAEWLYVPTPEAWQGFAESLSQEVADSSLRLDTVDVAECARLYAALHSFSTSAAHRSSAASLQQAMETIAERLVAQLEAATNALAGVRHAGDAPSLSDAPDAALPAPWTTHDVTAVWELYVAQEHDNAAGALPSNAAQSNPLSGYPSTLEKAGRALLAFATSAFVRWGSSDVWAVETALAMARTLLEVDEHKRHSMTRAMLPQSDVGGEAYADLSVLLPPLFVQALLQGSEEQAMAETVAWSPAAVGDAVAVLQQSTDGAHRECAAQLATLWYKHAQRQAQEGVRLLPHDLLAFFNPELLRRERVGVDAAVRTSLTRWSVSEVLYFFARLAAAGGAENATVLRTAGKTLCTYAAKASAAQLAALVECFGVAQVRNDEFCLAAMTRLAELLGVSLTSATRSITYTSVPEPASETGTSPSSLRDGAAASGGPPGDALNMEGVEASTVPVSLTQLTQLLRSFALMEVRNTAPFIDAATHVVAAAAADEGTAEEVTQLLAAYAKMLIWDYPVFSALSERLCRLRRADVSLGQLVTAQLALLRMDINLPAVTRRLYDAMAATYGPAAQPGRVRLQDAVVQLSVLSRLRACSTVKLPESAVVDGLISSIVARMDRLRVEELAEALVALARLGEGNSEAFDRLTQRALNEVPTAPPRVMAHIAEAYALAGRGDQAELFTLIAERTVTMRNDMAAITIASILASFARAGVRNDRLFIDVIPRVRHVATYGTPRDIVNVVSAYAAVNLWHYKLFARLADRAVQLRADFRVGELVKLLEAYATVQMRYDSLFHEVAPRVQTLAHLLTPAELASIVSSYSKLNIACVPVWKATAARAVAVVDLFTEAEAERLLDAYSTQNFYDEECVTALVERFPALVSIPFNMEDMDAHDGEETAQETEPGGKEGEDDDGEAAELQH